MSEKKKQKEATLKQSLEQAAATSIKVDKDFIRENVQRDLKRAWFFLSDVIESKDCIDALTDVYWARYEKLQENKSEDKEATLPLFQEGGQDVR